MKQETIKQLFATLTPDERQTLITELQELSTGGITVTEFAQLVQRTHRVSISFAIDSQKSAPMITATVKTPFGEYEAIGKNQKIAKARACQKAFQEFNQTK